MSNDNGQDKELLERYLRASDADTSAPSEAVRAAILAEGRRTADARAKEQRAFDAGRPAANDSRWKITAYGTAGAALLAALLFAPNLWETAPRPPSPAGAVQSPKLEALHESSDARQPAYQKTESMAQSVAPAKKAAPQNYVAGAPAAAMPTDATQTAATQTAAPPTATNSSTVPQVAASSGEPPPDARTFSANTPAASSARAAPLSPEASSLFVGGLSRMRSEAQQKAPQSAAAAGDAAQAVTLLDKGARLDARDENGRTPLMRAVLENRLEVVRLLLSRGADPNLADNTGTTPLRQAKRDHFNEIAAMLERAGAH